MRVHITASIYSKITLLRFVLFISFMFSILFVMSPVSAAAMPGGTIANPIVRAVDLAKPAVVRIITTLGGQLSVFFPNNTTALFPQNGDLYQIQASGTGTFISSHGDILTADHVINPPHDASLHQFLNQDAAQEIADYVNDHLHPPVPWKSQDAFNALNSGYFLSQAHYDSPTSKVYLSTDYTGPLHATTLQDLSPGIASDVDKIERDSPFDQQDLAIIHVHLDDTPSIPLADSSNVAQQDELTIIGFPGNGDISLKHDPTDMLTSSVNTLLVSAFKHTDSGTEVIQTGGNIEHGDSGGPALNSNGQIVGIVSFDQNTNFPEGTGFLQTSNNATALINSLGLDLTLGNFEQQWTQAFNDYASTAPNHWHKAQADFQRLTTNYPLFQATAIFLSYTQLQAQKELIPLPQSSQSHSHQILIVTLLCTIALMITMVLVIAFFARRRTSHQTRSAETPVL